VIDVAEVVSPGIPLRIIGIRPGEKLHEVMITEDDSNYTLEFDTFYAILAPFLLETEYYRKNGLKVPIGFSFTSANNKLWHTHETFRSVLVKAGILN
jgi:UDP-N-acetylglucosamine 4,6-dehydratase